MSTDLTSPSLYINRELSWLEFNDRVLREGMDPAVPLLERLKFLAIVSSNLDEFFMIRVAGLMQRQAAGVRGTDLSGLTADQQLDTVRARARRMMLEQADAVSQALKELAVAGIRVLAPKDLSTEQRSFLASMFAAELAGVLTPLAVESLSPCPTLPGQRLYLALLLTPVKPAPGSTGHPRQGPLLEGEAAVGGHLAVVPVPDGLPRFVTLPAAKGLSVIGLEDVLAEHAPALFPGYEMAAQAIFRITRDADVAVDEEDAAELLAAVEQAVRDRRRRAIVRLTLSAGADGRLKERLLAWLSVADEDIYEVSGMLDAAGLMELANRPGFDNLKDPPWPPQPPGELIGQEDLFRVLQERDILLLHPYESFDPVARLVEQAADDPAVLAIKMTLYRTSGDSPIVRALARAAEKGKQVTVLVELKARFDEAKNVQWARRLEDAGALVIYGVVGYKTHAKCLLVVRREEHRIRRYLHLSTGNYNDRTARLYSDIGMMTSDADLTADAAALFNLLTGYSQTVGWHKMVPAPAHLRPRLEGMVDREIAASTPDRPGLILAKLNSLEDPAMIRALCRASQAGVHVRLNVRGLCCLRPGVKGVSENIEVTGIVDRYLEHSRIMYFRNGGHEEVYLSSADWMGRNLDRRVEIMWPVTQPDLKRRLVDVLEIYFADTVKSRRLQSDGMYAAPGRAGPALRAQQRLYEQAVQAAKAGQAPPLEFRPLTRPK